MLLFVRPFLIISCFLLSISCQHQKYDFDLQGHRGARGLMPENSIPAFIEAVSLGVNTLELDLVVTKDGRILVSHEPWFSPTICLDSLGNTLETENKQQYNIYNHLYAQTAAYDCGSKGHARFPEQKNIKTFKPLLSDVIDTVEKYVEMNALKPIYYNVELKSSPKGDYIFHPSPATFSDMVHRVISDKLPPSRITIQSFDFRVLRYWHEHYPAYSLSALIESKTPIAVNLASLGFQPTIYSPYYKYLVPEQIDTLHQLGIMVIPWTVNEKDEMLKLLEWGIDGIITDYPNRAIQLRVD